MEIIKATIKDIMLSSEIVTNIQGGSSQDASELSAQLSSLQKMLIFGDYESACVQKMSDSISSENFNCQLSSGLGCYPFETLLTSFCKDNGASTWQEDLFLNKVSFLSRTVAASPIPSGTNVFIVISPTKASDFYDKTTAPEDTSALEAELKAAVQDGRAWKSTTVAYPDAQNVLIDFTADTASKQRFNATIANKLWIYWFKDDGDGGSLIKNVGIKVKPMSSSSEFDTYKDNTGPYWMINNLWYTPIIDVEFSTKLKIPYAFTKSLIN